MHVRGRVAGIGTVEGEVCGSLWKFSEGLSEKWIGFAALANHLSKYCHINNRAEAYGAYVTSDPNANIIYNIQQTL